MVLKFLLGRQPDLRRQAAALYSQLVSQARHPWFYTEAGVPDTLDGRFEVIVLHLWALQKQMKAEVANLELPTEKSEARSGGGSEAVGAKAPLAQLLMEIAFDDLDRSLRELGVGDMGVARRIRAMADGIYGRFEAYDRALGEEAALTEALKRNVYGTVKTSTEAIDLLVNYTLSLQKPPATEITQWPVLPQVSSA